MIDSNITSSVLRPVAQDSMDINFELDMSNMDVGRPYTYNRTSVTDYDK